MSDLISSELSEDMKNSWGTDQRVFDALNKEFEFDLDAAASDKNHKCEGYLTIKDDALSINWSMMMVNYILVKTVWINPPYGRGMIKKFMNKCV